MNFIDLLLHRHTQPEVTVDSDAQDRALRKLVAALNKDIITRAEFNQQKKSLGNFIDLRVGGRRYRAP